MAFSSILCRSASSFAPLTVRALRIQQNCHSAIFTALNQTRILSSETHLSPFLPPRSYSTERLSSDENLLQLLDSKIQCAEEVPMVEEAPGGFPFKIEDKPGLETIALSREYQGEEIKVKVITLVTGEDGGDDDHDDNDDKANRSSIDVVASVAKGNGQFIKINYTAYHDEIIIDCLAIRNPENSEDQILDGGLNFQNLDENLQKALHEYLEIRGIKCSTNNFLLEYMINKERREYLTWLKNLKKFVDA